MINFEQELEIAGNGHAPGQLEPVNPRLDGDRLYIDVKRNGSLYYHGWPFCAKTGVHWDQRHIDNPMRLRPKSETRPVTNYFLFVGRSDWEKDDWVKVSSEMFGDGRAAADRMKHHNGLFSTSMSPFRTMVKPETKLSEVRDYPTWAASRFETGEWAKLPWADEPWANKHPNHFAHLGTADNCQVAFWPNEASAQMDQVSILSPGRYLTQYFSEELTPTEIQVWATKVDVDCELKFASEPDEIVMVYSHPNSPASCMRYDDDYSGWSGGMNPTRVYGAGDLAIAYLERKGKIVARGLCWPEKKVFGRLYGDTDRMTAQLKAAGFKEDQSEHHASARGEGNFIGARLQKIVCDDHPDFYIMPYIDAGYGVKEHPTDDSLFVMTRGDGTIPCTYTNGLTGDPDEDSSYDYYCDACGDGLDDSDAYHLNDSTYCYSHYRDRAVDCYSCDNTIATDEAFEVDDENYCRRCYDRHTYQCDHCEERTADDLIPVYDARYDTETGPTDVTLNVCSGCSHPDFGATERVARDANGNLIDMETATQCDVETCGAFYSADAEQCPTCQPAADNNNETQTQELEAA